MNHSDPPLFTTDTLGDLDDGVTRLMIDAALADALADCDDRPTLTKPRRIVIQVELQPELNQRGAMIGVQAKAQVALRIPGQVTRSEFLPTNAKGDTIEARLPSDHARPLFVTTPANPEEEN